MPRVLAVSLNPVRTFGKTPQDEIRLVADYGVEGDTHAGATLKTHNGMIEVNQRQVHLIANELLEEMAGRGYEIGPGEIGDNVLTEGVDLINLPNHTRLRLGPEAVVELRGLRAPCLQLDRFARGLAGAMLNKTGPGPKVRTGVLGVGVTGGIVRAGDAGEVELPLVPHLPMKPM